MTANIKKFPSAMDTNTWADSLVSEVGASSSSYKGLRAEAAAIWSKSRFPTTRDEAWKYTDISPISKGDFGVAQVVSNQAGAVKAIEAFKLPGAMATVVLVNGIFREDLSALKEISGLRIFSLVHDAEAISVGSTAIHRESSLAALNSAMFTDGVGLSIDAGAKIEGAIQVISVVAATGSAVCVSPRMLINVGSGAEITVLETHLGAETEGYFVNAVTEIVADQAAHIDFYRFQGESKTAYHIGNIGITQQQDSTVRVHLLNTGSALNRNEISARLGGKNCNTILNGLSIGDGNQIIDNSTTLDHAEPHCESSELFKGVYSGKARGIFSGTIIVREDAQKTNAFQSNKALLLSDTSSIETRPQLKIWADDVKCTHGATVGNLDADALFYLRSRGVGLAEATHMLTTAFASDVLTSVKDNGIKEAFSKILAESLSNLIKS